MIFNTKISGGGIKEEDINAELLQTLDPDFRADNIAEGVDLFGLVGSHAGGVKMATGTVTVTTYTEGSGINEITYREVVVTGLPFTPADVILIANTGVGYYTAQSVRGTTAYAYNDEAKTLTCTRTLSSDGFTINTSGRGMGRYSGELRGTYYYIAWA